LTIGIGVTVTLHDFDYSFILKDFMAKRESMAGILFFLQDMILAGIAQVGIGQFMLWIHLVFVLSRIYDFAYEIPYYYEPVSRIYL
jgi:hypothetical protein